MQFLIETADLEQKNKSVIGRQLQKSYIKRRYILSKLYPNDLQYTNIQFQLTSLGTIFQQSDVLRKLLAMRSTPHYIKRKNFNQEIVPILIVMNIFSIHKYHYLLEDGSHRLWCLEIEIVARGWQ